MWQKKYYVQNATGRGTSRLPRFIRNTRAHCAMEKVTSKNSPPPLHSKTKNQLSPSAQVPSSFCRTHSFGSFLLPRNSCAPKQRVLK